MPPLLQWSNPSTHQPIEESDSKRWFPAHQPVENRLAPSGERKEDHAEGFAKGNPAHTDAHGGGGGGGGTKYSADTKTHQLHHLTFKMR